VNLLTFLIDKFFSYFFPFFYEEQGIFFFVVSKLRGERGQSSFQACISRMNLNFAIRVKFSNNLHEEDERIRGGVM